MRTVLVTLVLSAWAATAQEVSWTAETPFLSQVGDVALVRPPGEAPLIAAGEAQMTGVFLFDLPGTRVQTLPLGGVRGIDSRAGFLAVMAPFSQMVESYVFDAGMLTRWAPPIPLATANALALSRVGGALELWIDLGSPSVRRYRFDNAGAQLVETVVFPAAPAALVVDDRSGRVFASTAAGVYVLTPGNSPELLIELDGGQLGGLPAGEALYPLRDGGLLLVTAIPSRSDYVVHAVTAATADFLGRFSVRSPDRTLTVSNGAALDLMTESAPGFDGGLLIVTDGLRNNVKLVAWDAVARAFVPPLPVEVPTDAGAVDAGRPDAGVSDAGAHDAGADAGRDAGSNTDAGPQGGGAGGGTGVGGGRTGGGRTGGGGGDEQPSGCTCALPDFTLVPLLAGLWLVRTLRRRTQRS